MRDLCLGDQAIIDLLDGRATAPERAALEDHVDRCRACRALLAALARARLAEGALEGAGPEHLAAWARAFGRDLSTKPE